MAIAPIQLPGLSGLEPGFNMFEGFFSGESVRQLDGLLPGELKFEVNHFGTKTKN